MRSFLEIGLRLLPYIVACVDNVERFIFGKKGKEKEDDAVAMVASLLQVVEQGASQDLLRDPEIAKCVRAVMQATVALQNAIIRRESA